MHELPLVQRIIFVAIVPISGLLVANGVWLVATRPLGPFPSEQRIDLINTSIGMLGAGLLELLLASFLVLVGLCVFPAARNAGSHFSAPWLAALLALIYGLIVTCIVVWALRPGLSTPLLILVTVAVVFSWAGIVAAIRLGAGVGRARIGQVNAPE